MADLKKKEEKKTSLLFPESVKGDGWFRCHGDTSYMEFRKSISNLAASH